MRAGSLCAGIGGLDLATEAVFGTELAWYSEIDPAPAQVMAREWPDAPNLGDLTMLDWSDVEPVDVLTAGYPCQPFSHAGKRKGTDDDRHLWPYIAAAVRVLRPRVVVLENVAGHLSLGFGDVLGDLAEAGFDAEWCVFRASDVGACHRRARLFVVAVLDAGHDAGGTEQGEQPPAWPLRVGQPSEGVATDPAHVGHERGGQPRRRRDGSTDRGAATPTDTAGTERRTTGRTAEPRERVGLVAWGDYEPAIRRWELTLGRPAPDPTDRWLRLNPVFVEWMMGYPEGWVDGLSRTQALKALGNAVVPQQAAAALSCLVRDNREPVRVNLSHDA